MYVLFFSQSQFQMLPDIFSANHIVGLHLIRPFYPITLQEPLWNRWLQFITNVCLFLLGFLRTLLPFWYAWVINCSIVLYFRYFRIFSIPWKNLCVHEHVKKPLHFWGFLFLVFFFLQSLHIYRGHIRSFLFSPLSFLSSSLSCSGQI